MWGSNPRPMAHKTTARNAELRELGIWSDISQTANAKILDATKKENNTILLASQAPRYHVGTRAGTEPPAGFETTTSSLLSGCFTD